MTYKLFHDLLFYAMTSRDYNEFVDGAKKLHDWDDSLMSTGVLFSIWLYSVDHTSRKIRDFTGLSRAQFARDYGIPVRTLENWDLEKASPVPSHLDLLCFAVLNDVHSAPKKEAEPEAE